VISCPSGRKKSVNFSRLWTDTQHRVVAERLVAALVQRDVTDVGLDPQSALGAEPQSIGTGKQVIVAEQTPGKIEARGLVATNNKKVPTEKCRRVIAAFLSSCTVCPK
jgi:hypothetical protein